ncbi:MAG: sugar transferase [Pseudomonadales bacterium]|nr:sugar transferase [Pseudomonadales bacterium]
MQAAKAANKSPLSDTSNFTMLSLVFLDGIGVIILFNLNHWLIAGEFATGLLLTWKLVLILALGFLYNYLMDLYTFESPLSQLGMLERSFIAILLMGITIALIVYLLGPRFIGGFVGRGVLITSLFSLWIWSLLFRYLLKNWFITQRSQIHWLVIVDQNLEQFIVDFHSEYAHEKLLLLSPDDAPASIDYTLPNRLNIDHIGCWSDLSVTMDQHPVSGIILACEQALPHSLGNQLMQIKINGTRVYRLSDFYEKYLSRLPIFHLNQQWLTTALGFELIHSVIGLRFKRYIDVFIALTFGCLAMPVILATAMLIFISNGRPILFRQTRIGEDNTRFLLYKFRTMHLDAEKHGPTMAAKNDPRQTLFGSTLRKYRLDELPQLWNVLKGEMSFIGPRPERPEFITEFEKSIPYYHLRHMIKPGITGWAQVKHGYAESTEDTVEKLQFDLYYIKNYSLILDISILIKSIKVIVFGTGR